MSADRANPDRANNGRFTRTLAAAERDAAACRLRARGMTFQQIADQLGYADRSTAHRAVKNAIAAVPVHDVDELRQLQGDTLDAIRMQLWAIIRNAGAADAAAPGARRGGPAVVLQAVDRLLRVEERAARLYGLDAPTDHRIITVEAVESEIARLEAELAAASVDTAVA